MTQPRALTLCELAGRVTSAITCNEGLRNQWVVAETADLRVAGGHCYLELVEKDPNNGRPLARLRATIWQSTYYAIANKFVMQTGQQLRSDLRVMVLVSVNYHPVFGISANIIDINSEYTLGDVMQRRNQMIRQLQAEGIIEMNRRLQWPAVPLRIAVVSARGAAGYGDFINQLYNNPMHLRFETRLFPAMLQGDRAAESIIAALDAINSQEGQWDCVVIIRGGGAGTDLLCFDNYALAANIAQFPLPVVIGIGHERDITLLDWVANMRVKTPTAAAEWLIQRGEYALGALQRIAQDMMMTVTDRINGCHQQLAYIAGQLPAVALGAVALANNRLAKARYGLSAITDRHIRPELQRLDAYAGSLRQALTAALQRERLRLDNCMQLVEALSPQATLNRGYSITRVNGHTVTTAAGLRPGDLVHTILADGEITSTITN